MYQKCSPPKLKELLKHEKHVNQFLCQYQCEGTLFFIACCRLQSRPGQLIRSEALWAIFGNGSGQWWESEAWMIAHLPWKPLPKVSRVSQLTPVSNWHPNFSEKTGIFFSELGKIPSILGWKSRTKSWGVFLFRISFWVIFQICKSKTRWNKQKKNPNSISHEIFTSTNSIEPPMAGGDFQHFSPILCGFLSHWLPGQIGWTRSSSSRQSLVGWEALQGAGGSWKGFPWKNVWWKFSPKYGMPKFLHCKILVQFLLDFFWKCYVRDTYLPKWMSFVWLGMVGGDFLCWQKNWEKLPSHTTCVRSLVVLVRVPFGMWWSMKQWMIDVRCGIPVTWKKRLRHDLKKWGRRLRHHFF